MLLLPVLTALLLSSSPTTRAQDAKPPPSEPARATAEDLVLLKSAVSKARAVDLVLSGTVANEAKDSGMGGGMQIVIAGGGGGGGEDFHGKLEVVLTKQNELVALSAATLPEVALFDNGLRRLRRVTYEDEPVGTNQLATDLALFLDFERLLAFAEKGATVEPDGNDGAHLYSYALPKKMIKGASGPAAFAEAKVVRAEICFRIDKDGTLDELRLEVARTDPMAAFKHKAMKGGFASGGSIEVHDVHGGDADKDKDEEPAADVEAVSSLYSFHVEKSPISTRASAALASLRQLAQKD